MPEEAFKASLGCGNLTAPAELKSGEIVLGLGCGGIDVSLAAAGLDANSIAREVDGRFLSAFIKARKPARPNT